jgi:glycerol-3-phosphate acyltransferase PlsX
MGGDHGITVTVPASIQALQKYADISIILVGNKDLLEEELKNHSFDANRLSVHHADQVVDMDELPSKALRNKRQSSMRLALNLVKEDKADACVSAGNTGALMAVSKFVLKMIPGITRPAICSSLPTIKGHVHMLDLGANVGVDGEALAQFALMGSVLTQAVDNIDKPRVGLLNIGEEEIKGHQRIKDANEILKKSDINYIGYVEGDEIFKGEIDVIACDGFDGNIALKSSEGVAKMITHYLKAAFSQNILTKVVALLSLPVLKAFKEKVDPSRYNGAPLLGLRKIVIKSHGGADTFSFFNAIAEARLEASKSVPDKIELGLKEALSNEQKAGINESDSNTSN